MKRTTNLFDRIVERENLRSALGKALCGKRHRPEPRLFTSRMDERLREMSARILDGSFPLGRYSQFVIRDPKERTITAPCFAERVLHHSIMNVCEPIFERRLIHDSYACRVERGRVAAVERTRHFAGSSPFFLKMDVRAYFASISHDVLISDLGRVFKDARLLDLLERIIRCFQVNAGCGLPIGSLTSQHFANFYLGGFDRFVKEVMRVRGYVRYMDDMLLFGRSHEELQLNLLRCETLLDRSLRLRLKPVPYINRMTHGVEFLGCRVFPNRVVLTRRAKVRFRRKLHRLEERYLRGEIDERALQERATALVAFTRSAGAKSWRFRRAVLQQLPVSGQRPPTG